MAAVKFRPLHRTMSGVQRAQPSLVPVMLFREQSPAVVWLQQDYPSYQQLDSLLRGLDWSQSSKPLLKRVSDEIEFLQVSGQRLHAAALSGHGVCVLGGVHFVHTGGGNVWGCADMSLQITVMLWPGA
mgnify:FL=1